MGGGVCSTARRLECRIAICEALCLDGAGRLRRSWRRYANYGSE